MNFKAPHLLSFAPPILEIPAHQVWHRVQRTTARRGSVRLKGYVLAPAGGLTGRFDLADEPTAALDGTTGRALMDILRRLTHERGRTVVMVTHDSRVLEYADRIVHMEDGGIR